MGIGQLLCLPYVFQLLFWIWTVCGVSTPLLAQVPAAPLFPGEEKEGEIGEVGEVGETMGEQQQLEELKFTQKERRLRFEYDLAASVGVATPWQLFGMEGHYLVRPDTAVGMFIGAGTFNFKGRIGSRQYDMEIKSRSFGVDTRLYLSKWELLSFQVIAGYGTWDGSTSPHGSDDGLESSSEKLAASFKIHGPFVGIAASLTWLWESGLYLQWSPVGIRRSWALGSEFSRSSDQLGSTVLDRIESPAVYGLANFKVGMFL